MFLQCKGVSKSYKAGNSEFKALDSVDFELDSGEIGVVLGPSGSGKSTLLNLVGGIDSADSGEILIAGEDITKLKDKKVTEYRRKNVGFIFQFYNLIPNLTVYENVEVSSNISKNPLDIKEVLKAVGMEDMKDRFPKELSGGQQQRVSIARAIVKNPRLLLCDEPTGALDFNSSIEVLKLLETVRQKYNTAIMIITHNTAISGLANKVVKLRSGKISDFIENKNIVDAERIEW